MFFELLEFCAKGTTNVGYFKIFSSIFFEGLHNLLRLLRKDPIYSQFHAASCTCGLKLFQIN